MLTISLCFFLVQLGQKSLSETNLFPLQRSHFPTPSLDLLSGYFAKSMSFAGCGGRNEICTQEESPCNTANTRDACSKLCKADYSCISFEWQVSTNGCQMSTTCTGASGGTSSAGWELWVKTWRSMKDGTFPSCVLDQCSIVHSTFYECI